MKRHLTSTTLPAILAIAFFAVALISTPNFAFAHDGEVHEEDAVHTTALLSADANIATMQQIIALLTHLLAVMQQKVALETGMTADHDDEHETHEEGLKITVETHGDRTHVHVYTDGEETDSFFVDAAVTDEVGVIDEIVAQTDLERADVESATIFPSDKHEDEHEDEHDEDMNLDGIHIMADGTVMLGDGTVLEDATVTDDGMIKLSDGTQVTPEMDLR